MTIPLDIWMDIEENNNGNDWYADFAIRPALRGYCEQNYAVYIGARTNVALINVNPSADLFASVQDAEDYAFTLEAQNILDSMNSKHNNIYHMGVRTYNHPDVNNADKAIIASVITAKDRANHTGTQSISTVSGLQTALDAKSKAYEGTTLRANCFPIFKSATVGSGVATFHLTNDGLSTGTALFPNGVIADSVNAFVSDATASYQMAYAFSNSNKTLTVTANKLTTSNILTGILGQAAANAAVVKLQVWGY